MEDAGVSGTWRLSSADFGARILAIASHDLRNLLSNLVLNLEILSQSELIAGSGTEHVAVQRAKRSALQMRSMVENLQQLVAIEQDSMCLELAEFDAQDLLEDVVETQVVLAESRRLRLSAEPPRHICRVLADRRRLLQVVTNLVSNSIKFTPGGGSISASAERDSEGVWFAVKDTGIGIPACDLENVFTRFWQSGSGSHSGVGLGLSIAKSIVEAHGGRIRLRSRVGEGTTVAFLIPHRPKLER